ncbi:hypothetical protein [Desulfosporosinus sp. Sb-LF]|uniref:hypothetical protein n=1 Tax=Desulfosporosinus sp. Sb-LF TaxID=2560027 RepID=UPI0013054003|nr:hypothetical protein [Desulfosporosinus sp. Sb-LF]
MNSSNNADGPDISKLKAKVLELELELTAIETGWLLRRKLRKKLKEVQAEIDGIERKL